MAKFNYKKWVTENKHGKLSEMKYDDPFDQEEDDPKNPMGLPEVEKDPDAQAAAPKGGEGEAEEKPEVDTSGGLVDINDGPEAVLKKVTELPTSIFKAGQTDGNPGDEKIAIKSGTAIAKDMIPTQNVIGSKQSLWDQVTDSKFGSLDLALKGGKIGSKAGMFPILTFGGKYILDGHHRWSQFLATNPDATVDIADISAPGVDSSDKALALTHIILKALYGKSPTKDFEGENLISKDAKWVEAYVMKNIVDSAVKKLHAAGKIEEPKKELAAKMYADNIFGPKGANLKKGTHPRTIMPQGGDAGDPTGLTKVPADAAAGKVNYIAPKQSDVKVAAESKDPRASLYERMEKIINKNL